MYSDCNPDQAHNIMGVKLDQDLFIDFFIKFQPVCFYIILLVDKETEKQTNGKADKYTNCHENNTSLEEVTESLSLM